MAKNTSHLLSTFKDISDLIDFVAHEIKSPLTNIKIYSEILRRHPEKTPPQKTLEYLTIIDNKTDLIVSRVNRLTDLFKLERGLIPLHKKSLDLSKFISSSLTRNIDEYWFLQAFDALNHFYKSYEPLSHETRFDFFPPETLVVSKKLATDASCDFSKISPSTLKPLGKQDIDLLFASLVFDLHGFTVHTGLYKKHLVTIIKFLEF